MKKLVVSMMLLLLCLSLPACALMTGGTITGEYSPESRSARWIEGLEVLGNSPGRVYADKSFFSGLGSTERLYFQGSEIDFQQFLNLAAKVSGVSVSLSVESKLKPAVINHGQPKSCTNEASDPVSIPYDWSMVHHIPNNHRLPETLRIHAYNGVFGATVSKLPKGIVLRNPVATGKPAFGIYLLKDGKLKATEAVKVPLEQLKIQDKPLLSLADIKWFDWDKQSFELSPSAVSRLPKAAVFGTPFVLIANGKRIYSGGFFSFGSSASLYAPAINVGRLLHKDNVYTIEAGYPGKLKGSPDLRFSDEFKKALSEVGWLTAE